MLESVPARILEAEEAPLAIPNLLALAEESVTFRRAYAPSVHSDYAQMAILSSLHPRKYPAHDFYERLDYPRTLLWDALAPAGWNTAMFSCQNENWGNMIRYLSTAGLRQLRHSPDWPNALHHGRGSESKVYEATVVGAWQEWLASGASEPWLSYLNFQATHFPYETPINAPRPFTPDEIDFAASFVHYPRDKVEVVRNRYLNALHYADRYVGEVIRVLKQRGEWENTILAVVSDHGEAFYEHGHPTHGTSLFEEQVRSLMMVRFPGQPGRVVDNPVSLMDLAPSLIRRLGLTEHGNFQGRSDIFEPGYSAAGRPFHFTIQGLTDEDGILVDDWKYIVNWRTGSRQMYHLASDPGEKDDRAAVDPGRADRLHQQLMDFLGRQLAYYDRQGWKQGQYAAALP
jgi:arylsulfatase A-like enzyme